MLGVDDQCEDTLTLTSGWVAVIHWMPAAAFDSEGSLRTQMFSF